jgi:hypothetical protein
MEDQPAYGSQEKLQKERDKKARELLSEIDELPLEEQVSIIRRMKYILIADFFLDNEEFE